MQPPNDNSKRLAYMPQRSRHTIWHTNTQTCKHIQHVTHQNRNTYNILHTQMQVHKSSDTCDYHHLFSCERKRPVGVYPYTWNQQTLNMGTDTTSLRACQVSHRHYLVQVTRHLGQIETNAMVLLIPQLDTTTLRRYPFSLSRLNLRRIIISTMVSHSFKRITPCLHGPRVILTYLP